MKRVDWVAHREESYSIEYFSMGKLKEVKVDKLEPNKNEIRNYEFMR
jgi:hypothetical protein